MVELTVRELRGALISAQILGKFLRVLCRQRRKDVGRKDIALWEPNR
jgi:hypothetical protein